MTGKLYIILFNLYILIFIQKPIFIDNKNEVKGKSKRIYSGYYDNIEIIMLL
jgi:hypothetical protein